MASRLHSSLEEVWQTVLRLPDEDSDFDALEPMERRAAHDLGLRIQDRLLRALSRLVEGMAADGVDLVDDEGVPSSYRDERENN
ncbi:MAG: hypothetical protein VX498_05780 [Myxococcota bacterium]|nr:hypothetical protein [Myxococcota bacterium]